jgi:ABC-type cobalamin/Fe3+-siderophores transport system ATPase subunit
VTEVLSVRGLVKSYGERTVLAGVDLDVAEHEVVVLIGASGSGKSTLLKSLQAAQADGFSCVRLLVKHAPRHAAEADSGPADPAPVPRQDEAELAQAVRALLLAVVCAGAAGRRLG